MTLKNKIENLPEVLDNTSLVDFKEGLLNYINRRPSDKKELLNNKNITLTGYIELHSFKPDLYSIIHQITPRRNNFSQGYFNLMLNLIKSTYDTKSVAEMKAVLKESRVNLMSIIYNDDVFCISLTKDGGLKFVSGTNLITNKQKTHSINSIKKELNDDNCRFTIYQQFN